VGERVLEEGEYVKERGLSSSVRAHDDRERAQLPQLGVPKQPVVLDPDVLDVHLSALGSADLGDHGI